MRTACFAALMSEAAMRTGVFFFGLSKCVCDQDGGVGR